MSDVYRFKGWDEVARLFEGMNRVDLETVGAWLTERAERLLQGWRAGSQAAGVLLSNWHPEFIGRSQIALDSEPSLDGARVTVAREHGFADWADVERAYSRPFDPGFESAVDLMLAGLTADLRRALAARSELVDATSPFGHRATLLHYMAANGVETERQVTPLNAAEIVALLLEAGADPASTMPVYGGEHTPLELLTTSAHPAQAGVVDEVASLLRG